MNFDVIMGEEKSMPHLVLVFREEAEDKCYNRALLAHQWMEER